MTDSSQYDDIAGQAAIEYGVSIEDALEMALEWLEAHQKNGAPGQDTNSLQTVIDAGREALHRSRCNPDLKPHYERVTTAAAE